MFKYRENYNNSSIRSVYTYILKHKFNVESCTDEGTVYLIVLRYGSFDTRKEWVRLWQR